MRPNRAGLTAVFWWFCRGVLGAAAATCGLACRGALFQPRIAGKSLPEQIFAAVAGCEIDLRRTLLKNVVLAGGTTCFPGFPARLQVLLP